MKRLLLLPVLAVALSLPAPAPGQCVMCYLSAKSQNNARARVLDLGIVVLGVPPFLILAGFIAFVLSRNNRYRGD
jgi:hypothetical protein